MPASLETLELKVSTSDSTVYRQLWQQERGFGMDRDVF